MYKTGSFEIDHGRLHKDTITRFRLISFKSTFGAGFCDAFACDNYSLLDPLVISCDQTGLILTRKGCLRCDALIILKPFLYFPTITVLNRINTFSLIVCCLFSYQLTIGLLYIGTFSKYSQIFCINGLVSPNRLLIIFYGFLYIELCETCSIYNTILTGHPFCQQSLIKRYISTISDQIDRKALQKLILFENFVYNQLMSFGIIIQRFPISIRLLLPFFIDHQSICGSRQK